MSNLIDFAIDVTPVYPSASPAIFAGWPSSYTSYCAPARPPLTVERRRTDQGTVFLVSDPVTGIFGSGASAYDAVRDLAGAQKEHREVLEAQENLSLALEEQLRYLQRR